MTDVITHPCKDCGYPIESPFALVCRHCSRNCECPGCDIHRELRLDACPDCSIFEHRRTCPTRVNSQSVGAKTIEDLREELAEITDLLIDWVNDVESLHYVDLNTQLPPELTTATDKLLKKGVELRGHPSPRKLEALGVTK